MSASRPALLRSRQSVTGQEALALADVSMAKFGGQRTAGLARAGGKLPVRRQLEMSFENCSRQTLLKERSYFRRAVSKRYDLKLVRHNEKHPTPRKYPDLGEL